MKMSGLPRKKLSNQAPKTVHLKGRNILWNYFLAVTRSEGYIGEIRRLRKKYLIPSKGFKWQPPYQLPPPDLNVNYHESQLPFEVFALCRKYGLHAQFWRTTIETHLFYNKIDGVFVNNDQHASCFLQDVERSKLHRRAGWQEEDDRAFPIMLRITPYTTITQLRDFVDKFSKQIRWLQAKYKMANVKIGRVRARPSHNYYSFIYKLRSRPHKEIADRVQSKFGRRLSEQHISMIISRMKKRQHQV